MKTSARSCHACGRLIAGGRPILVGSMAALAILFYSPNSLCAEEPAAAGTSTSSIRLNTVGYLPTSSKQATIQGQCDKFMVREALTGHVVLHGAVAPVGTSEDSDDQLFVADFTDLREPGSYKVEVPGVGISSSFRIEDEVYDWPFYTCVRAMYLWRCGSEVKGNFAGDTFRHAACHMNDAYLDYAVSAAGNLKDGVGGWHDAGDYNKYVVNAAFTLGMMMQAWEHFQDRLGPLSLDLPESNNTVPDYLDEIQWELDWMLKMQADDGSVFHKLSTLKFGGYVLPEEESEQRYLSPWGSAATADFVAVMAQAARIFKPYDAEFAARCLAAAEKSYQFLKAHPEDHRPNQSAFSTGPYDTGDDDDRLWAAAELWVSTGQQEYLRDLERRIQTLEDKANAVDADWDWQNMKNLGLFTYILSSRSGRNPALIARVRQATLNTADEIVAKAKQHPYGRPLSAYYWGCNGTVARVAMNLNVADRLTSDPKYRDAMVDALNYLFGRNPFGRSFVTGLGHHPPSHPHDRRSIGDKVKAPWPGYLVGGGWPGPNDWHDDQEDYRTNEVAINWNGSLIYALAAFVQPASFDKSVAEARPSADKTPNVNIGSD